MSREENPHKDRSRERETAHSTAAPSVVASFIDNWTADDSEAEKGGARDG